MRNKRSCIAAALVLLASCSAPEAPKPSVEPADGIVLLTGANFDREVLRSQQPVLVDVGAPG